MIELISVTKKYGAFEALKGIDLTVSRSGLFAFLGPNGAGKTTTIKILTGVLMPDGGDAKIGGISITKDPVGAKNRFGYLPDIPTLFDKLSGSEYLNFIMDIFNISKNDRPARTQKFVEIFEMGPSMTSLIESYSLGMRKKIGLIAALCHNPEVLFLDEPTSGLDPQSVKYLKDILVDFTKDGGTVFFSTHILEIAEKICTRVGIISNGLMVADGTIAQIREKMKSGSGGSKSLEDIFLELTSPVRENNA